MSSREEQKEQKEKTSRALIQAALELGGAEGYASLSLRSVARKAGIAPTSFYRHFRDMDELGLAMADQAQQALRHCLDRARKKMALPAMSSRSARADLLKSLRHAMRPWVEAFMEGATGHGELLRLFLQERTGSSRALRAAISGGVDQLTAQLAEDLERASRQAGIRLQEIRSTAEAVMTLTVAGAMDLLVGAKSDSEEEIDRLIAKLGLLLLGAATRE